MDLVTDSPSTWARLITDNFISLSVGGVPDTFRGSLRRCDLGGAVRMTEVGTDRSRVFRTTRGVRTDGCNDVLLLAPIDRPAVVRQEGSQYVVAPGGVSVHVAERPYELIFDRPSRVLVLQAPRAIVPSPELVSAERRRTVDNRGSGVASVFRAFATEVIAMAAALSDQDREELGATAEGLAVTVLRSGQELEPAPGGRRALLAAARSFGRRHLSDPRLTPAMLAASQRVSLRSLQLAFALAGSSPATFIRTERLRLSRRLLADPRYSTLSVAQVAQRVGYCEANAFIRAFRREYAAAPGAWRTAQAEARR